ncbi:MAG: type II toxin-antitoxin system PemK/MazF family toxin [Chloroflexi bacterium]|nr:type II toxin-antitoxin system PemK/MazF family toxin [Chloroflexota bacterium]
MAFRRGEVVLVPFPFTDQSGQKVRPAIVLSGEVHNSVRPDIIVGALTSNIGRSGAFDYVLTDWEAAGLRFPAASRRWLRPSNSAWLSTE